MKRFAWLAVVCLALIPCARAQEAGNFQVGAFADYYRSSGTNTNMFGIGGRLGLAVADNTLIEGDIAYDFNRTFNNSFIQTDYSGVSFVNSNVSMLHVLIGPRYVIGHSRIRPFVELKGGFVNYMFGSLEPGFTSFSNQLNSLRMQNINGAILAGGGLESKVGPIGLRLDVADEMYFNSGAHSGLKIMFGPVIQF
jgi:hypothetical protein